MVASKKTFTTLITLIMLRGEGSEGIKNRPCDACRRRKIRCVMSEMENVCALCKSHSDECTFVESAPRKKRRLEGTGTKSGDHRRRESSSAQPVSNRDSQDQQSLNAFASPAGPFSLLRRTLGHQNRQSISYIGLTSEHDPQLLSFYTFTSNGEYKGSDVTYRHVGYHLASDASNFVIRDDLPTEVEEEIRDLDAIEAVIAPHGPALVDLYFRIVHPSFPILHKKVFLEKHGRTYRELTPIGLGAVYIIALDWWSYSPELCKLAKPDIKELDRLVRKSMMGCLDRPKISDLQGSLILLQRTDSHSWPMTGQLVAVAQELGLHDDCSAWNVPVWEPGVRKRVAWALFAQDKWGAMVYGRPSHLSMPNWQVTTLTITDFPETSLDDDDEEGSVEVEKGRLIFVHFIALTQILADVLDTFFTLRMAKSLSGRSTVELLASANPLQDRLRLWYAALPGQLSMEDSKSRKLSSTGYLHLAYYAVDITIHRAILRAYDHAILDPSFRQNIRSAATTCLLSTMELVKQLKPAHLQSFWYFASKHNLSLVGTLGGVLWSSSDTPAEREMLKAALAEYRWTLRISSTGAPFMRRAIAALDASPVFAAIQPQPIAAVQESPFDPSQLDLSLQGWFNEANLPGQQMIAEADDGELPWAMFV